MGQRVSEGVPLDDPTRCCDHGELITALLGDVRELGRQLDAALTKLGLEARQ